MQWQWPDKVGLQASKLTEDGVEIETLPTAPWIKMFQNAYEWTLNNR